jgi:hypothetical protein
MIAMSMNQLRTVHALLQVGGAMAVFAVQRTPSPERLRRGLALGVIGVALAEMLEGSRSTAELLRGASAALRHLA